MAGGMAGGMAGDMAGEGDRREHILQELGFGVSRSGDELRGGAAVVPELWVPGTQALRTSILATWCDTLCGYLAVDVLAPRVPVTLELDVHLYEPHLGTGRIEGIARTVKAGRAVAVAQVDFTDAAGVPIGTGSGTFMTAPDPDLRMPVEIRVPGERPEPVGGPLSVPFAERAGCVRTEPGVAVLPRSEAGLNAAGTVNGGLLALLVEEAALSAAPEASFLSSMAMRFLRPVRVGPAAARARVHAGVGRVEVGDEGRGGALAVVATTRATAIRR